MKFRTEYKVNKSRLPLSVERPMLMLGSCFTDNIGSILRDGGWDVSVNPCGTLFNTFSICRVIRLALDPDAEPLIIDRKDNGNCFSWDFPTAFSSGNEETARSRIGSALEEVRRYVLRSQAVIITLGTSLIYSLVESGRIVANCHKMPQKLFESRLAGVDEQMQELKAAIACMRRANPDIRVLLTVSPVRYLSQGFAANTRSKARLILLCEALESEGVAGYFPAYEILNDDLRSYRFYTSDLIHPSADASRYIADIFKETYLESRDQQFLSEGEAIRRRLNHKPMTDLPEVIEKFNTDTLRIREEFLAAHPAMRIDIPD